MDKTKLVQLFKDVICLESGTMKLCGRQKCIAVLSAMKEYIKENNLNVSVDTLGDVDYGKIYINQVMSFYNEFLSE